MEPKLASYAVPYQQSEWHQTEDNDSYAGDWAGCRWPMADGGAAMWAAMFGCVVAAPPKGP